MAGKYRNLLPEEIKTMTANGCFAQAWAQIEVSEGFMATQVRSTTFAGRIKMGSNTGKITNTDGMERLCGIYNAEIIDCTIGDNVFISNVGTYIANYNIGDNVYIESVSKIVCRGASCFGNGVEVTAINEGGGREVPIYDTLTAQSAYIMAMYRHRPQMVAQMKAMIAAYCETIRSDRGTIEDGVRITGCNTLIDTNIGPYAVINCATMLSNGTVNSSKESPSYIGAGVKAHDFMCSHGALVDNGASLNRCYVGEACKIDYGYMASDSLFFSNCDCANGEACSIFAGPYTVSHHKSSLLIAGYFLFFNAGSGSNQSNHLFKTGAVHQGIHERGCKFASDAYVMLPAREGAFTVILGRHKNHHNTEFFPYSYLMEEDGKSYLVPGINLRSYGTLRDLGKWSKRDRRGTLRRDRINFEEHNPYVGIKLMEALQLSKKMLAKERIEVHNYRMVKIKSVMLRRGMGLYQLAIDALVGDILSKGCASEVKADKHWVDASGMFAPKGEIEKLLTAIEDGSIGTLNALESSLAELDSSYRDHAYAWAIEALGSLLEREPSEIDITEAVAKGAVAAATIHKMREDDAHKDAEEAMETGYGIDAAEREERNQDFRNVRKIVE